MKAKKTTLHIPVSKPRNPVMVAALTKRAGAHGKSQKAVRQQQRQRLTQHLGELLDEEMDEFGL